MSSLCLAHHAVRLWRSPRRWSRGTTNPVQICWKSHVFFRKCVSLVCRNESAAQCHHNQRFRVIKDGHLPSERGEEKYVKRKKYTCVLKTHIRIHVFQDLVHLDFSGPPGVASRPLGSHSSTPHAECVRECVYKHTTMLTNATGAGWRLPK